MKVTKEVIRDRSGYEISLCLECGFDIDSEVCDSQPDFFILKCYGMCPMQVKSFTIAISSFGNSQRVEVYF